MRPTGTEQVRSPRTHTCTVHLDKVKKQFIDVIHRANELVTFHMKFNFTCFAVNLHVTKNANANQNEISAARKK